MFENPGPWIVLAIIVVVSLHMKGYITFPTAKKAEPNPVATDALITLGSERLGRAFATAKRREAEEAVASEIARVAGESIHSTFSAPFLPPAPAGPNPRASHP